MQRPLLYDIDLDDVAEAILNFKPMADRRLDRDGLAAVRGPDVLLGPAWTSDFTIRTPSTRQLRLLDGVDSPRIGATRPEPSGVCAPPRLRTHASTLDAIDARGDGAEGKRNRTPPARLEEDPRQSHVP